MRIWSLSAQYLDPKGLVALWRETLLAKHVLAGKTKGYRNHPQLDRFKAAPRPLDAIDSYLAAVFAEAEVRGYHFDASKFTPVELDFQIPVTTGQVAYELEHLQRKLATRAPELLEELSAVGTDPQLMPLFTSVPGEIETWEILPRNN